MSDRTYSSLCIASRISTAIGLVIGCFGTWIRMIPSPLEVTIIFPLVHQRVFEKPPPIRQGPADLLNRIQEQENAHSMGHSKGWDPYGAVAGHFSGAIPGSKHARPSRLFS